jgi:alanine-glyoxylate transaminase / serine-glyoxylate transaminase / serine-pyruvate transaminase
VVVFANLVSVQIDIGIVCCSQLFASVISDLTQLIPICKAFAMEQINMDTQIRQSPILLAPGPTEVDPSVLRAMASVAESHFSQPFCNTFGDVLSMLRKLFRSEDPDAQPFVIGGSGTLGWDFVATNFIETGEPVLCLSTGFFSDAFETCLFTYGAQTQKMTVPIGAAPDLQEVEKALRQVRYKALVVTHVDTSTGVLTPLKPLSDLLKRTSPETLLVVDGVASVACEDIQFDAWDIDIVVTGSQKAIGCPPGLSIIMVSARALQVAETRKGPPKTWYASLTRWLPIMQKYEKKESSYFATPPTQIVRALHASLTAILSRPLEGRFRQHREKSARVKAAVNDLGLTQLATRPENQANGLTAFWLPDGLSSEALLSKVREKGITLVAGMHKEVGHKYVRFGHMGYSVVGESERHIDRGVEALKAAITEYYTNQSNGFVTRGNADLTSSVLAKL